MRKLLLPGLLVLLAATAFAQPATGWLKIEEEVAVAVKNPQITVVHFWAPWCPNSKAELAKSGWSTFLAQNREIKFVFVTVRSADDGKALLAENGVGPQPNLTLLHHPNFVRKGEASIQSFMGLPMTWVPTTWIFRDGKLRYALNYGEVSFPTLQQLIRDTADAWEH